MRFQASSGNLHAPTRDLAVCASLLLFSSIEMLSIFVSFVWNGQNELGAQLGRSGCSLSGLETKIELQIQILDVFYVVLFASWRGFGRCAQITLFCSRTLLSVHFDDTKPFQGFQLLPKTTRRNFVRKEELEREVILCIGFRLVALFVCLALARFCYCF